MVGFKQSTKALAIAIYILTVPKIAIRPIIDSIAVTTSVICLAIVNITIRVGYLVEAIWC